MDAQPPDDTPVAAIQAQTSKIAMVRRLCHASLMLANADAMPALGLSGLPRQDSALCQLPVGGNGFNSDLLHAAHRHRARLVHWYGLILDPRFPASLIR